MNAAPRVRLSFTPQAGPQVAFLRCPADIVVYGGSRGGGKTYAVLGEFWPDEAGRNTACQNVADGTRCQRRRRDVGGREPVVVRESRGRSL